MQQKLWESRQMEEVQFKDMNYKIKQETTKPKTQTMTIGVCQMIIKVH